MLNTQVQYWNTMENRRHNINMERLEAQSIGETIRHNKNYELIEFQKNAEGKRHNVMTEDNQRVQADAQYRGAIEQGRHNVVEESIGRQNAYANLENSRTNAYSAQTNRELGYANVDVAQQNAESTRVANLLKSRELGIRQTEANIKQQEADTHYASAKARAYTDAAQTAISGLNTAYGILRNAQIASHTYSTYNAPLAK